jgi:hypothetical protein
MTAIYANDEGTSIFQHFSPAMNSGAAGPKNGSLHGLQTSKPRKTNVFG